MDSVTSENYLIKKFVAQHATDLITEQTIIDLRKKINSVFSIIAHPLRNIAIISFYF